MNNVAETTVNPMDLTQLLLNIIKDNGWILIGVILFIVFCVVSLNKIVAQLFNFLYNRIFKDSEYIEFGKLKIKNRNKQQQKITPRFIDQKSFVNMIDILLSNEIESIISKTIEITNAIHVLETNFNNSLMNIFRTNFAAIRNIYHRELIQYICDKTKFTIDRVHTTREYFFIDELLNDTERSWLETSQDIAARNGVVDIAQNPSKARTYIEELEDCITRSINMRRLECTVLTMDDLTTIIDEVSRTVYPDLEQMFIRIGNLKRIMLEKRAEKMNKINTDIKGSVSQVINDVETKFIDAGNQAVIQQTTENSSN